MAFDAHPPIPRPRRGIRALSDRSDDQLLALVVDGDRVAYGELYRRYSALAARSARRLVAPRDQDDVVSEGFLKVLQAIENHRGPRDHADRYLMVSIRSAAIDLHERRARETRWIAEEPRAEPASGEALPVDDRLVSVFASLPGRWRTALWWQIVEGRTPTEIGERLGLSPNAAAALCYRARHGLRTAYLGDDADR